MLKYALHRNRLTQGAEDFVAIPQSLSTKRIEDIIAQITQPGSILKQTECVAVIHDFFRAISENLKEGHSFVSEYIRIRPGISGVFNGADDQYDQGRHELSVHVSATSALKNALAAVRLEKVAAGSRTPVIKSVIDFKSGEVNGQLSPGHTIEIRGSRLKVESDQEDEGVYLVNSSDNQETRLETIYENKPGRIIAMIPEDVPAGSYLLEIRKRFQNNKTLSIGVFTTELSVN